MANHADIGDALSAALKHFRKGEAFLEHARDAAASANYTSRLYDAALDDTDNDQKTMKATMGAYLAGIETRNAQASLRTLRSTLERTDSLAGLLDDELGTSQSDKEAGMITYEYLDTEGVITFAARKGRLGKLREQMLTDAREVLQNGVTIGVAFAAEGTVVGVIARTSSTFLDHCMSGKMVFECIDDTVDAPKFRVTHEMAQTELPIEPNASGGGGSGSDIFGAGTVSLAAHNNLEVDKSFCDGNIGISAILLNRSRLTNSGGEAGDASNVFSAWTITNPAEADSDKGKIYIKCTRQASGPTFLIEWYKDGSFESLVQSTTADTVAGTTALTMTGSKMTVATTFDNVAAAVAMAAAGNTYTTVTYDIASPREGERWVLTTANDHLGVAATKLSKIWRASLASDAGAHADYAEAEYASVAMT